MGRRRYRRPPIERKLNEAKGTDLDKIAGDAVNLVRAKGEPDEEFRKRVLHVALRPHVGTVTSQMFRQSPQQPKNMDELLEMEAKAKAEKKDPTMWSPADLAASRASMGEQEFKKEILGAWVPNEEPEGPETKLAGQAVRVEPLKGPLKWTGKLRDDVTLSPEDLEKQTDLMKPLMDQARWDMEQRMKAMGLDTATGADLDALAGDFLGVTRKPGETDVELRGRVLDGEDLDEQPKPKPKVVPRRRPDRDWDWGN
jgi:hypothetical protein